MPATIRAFLRSVAPSHVKLNHAVTFAFLMRGAQVLGGFAALMLVASYFTPRLQGYYYTFNALTSLQMYLELGFGQVIVQFTSHEWAQLNFTGERTIIGPRDALSRLISVARIAFPFYALIGVVLIVVLSVTGFVLFGESSDAGIYWTFPWLALSVLTGINLWLLLPWLLLEGCNQVREVYFFRFTDHCLTGISLCLAIALGAGLWAPGIAAFVKCLYCAGYLYCRHRRFLRVFFAQPSGPRIHWRTEMLPMQWRISLTWLSGSLLFAIFTPVAFHYQGPVVAGQVGMTLSMTNALSVISYVWISAIIPTFGILIARREYAALNRLFLRKATMSFGTGVLGALALYGAVYALHATGSPLAERLLPLQPTAVFLVASLCLIASGPFGTYLRAHKREPLMATSVISSVTAGLSIWWFGSRFGPMGMATAYLLVMMGSLIVVLIVWQRCRRQWHHQPAQSPPSALAAAR